MKKTLVLLLAVFALVGFMIYKSPVGLTNDSGGWSIGIVSLDSGESLDKVYSKIENKEFFFIDQNQITNGDSVVFLADPFLINYKDTIYLFAECQIEGRGAYIVTYEIDSIVARFHGIAIKEPFHMSFPSIVNFGGFIIMTPETQRGDSSFVYRAKKFPLEWERMGIIVPERIKDPYILPITEDSGIVYYSKPGRLYNRSITLKNNNLRVYDEKYMMTGVYHRNGGGVVFENEKEYLVLQGANNGYGTSLGKLEISKTDPKKHFSKVKPILSPSRQNKQFAAGMHHLSVVHLSHGKRLVAVDGNKLNSNRKIWNIKHILKMWYLEFWNLLFNDNQEPYYPFSF